MKLKHPVYYSTQIDEMPMNGMAQLYSLLACLTDKR